MAKMLSDALKQKLLAMPIDELTVSKITELFGRHATRDGKITEPIYVYNDIVNLKANEYINKKDITTTAGRILFNKITIEGKIDSIIPDGFFNKPLTSKAFGGIANIISEAILAQKIEIPKVSEFLKAFEFYGLKACPIFSPSFTDGVLKEKPEVQAEKERILKNKDLDKMPASEIIDLEDHLIDMSRKANKNDPGMTLYDSGSRGAFDNDYKNISVMIGTMLNPETGKYDMVKTNYMKGIAKEDIYKIANGVVNASYPRGVSTAVGGYLVKQFYSVFQSVMVDEKGTDCGSKFTLKITLTEDNYKKYEFQFIADNGKLVELNPETKAKYMGKVIRLRTPMGCLGDHICNACAGNRYYYSDIKNVGLSVGAIPNSLMQKQMKKFHNQKLKLKVVDPDKLLI